MWKFFKFCLGVNFTCLGLAYLNGKRDLKFYFDKNELYKNFNYEAFNKEIKDFNENNK